MGAGIHSLLIGLATRAVQLLPASVHGALDAWSRRVARERATRRQAARRR